MSDKYPKKFYFLVKRGFTYSEKRVEIDKETIKYFKDSIYSIIL